MTRRRLLWAGAVLLVLLVAGLGWLLLPPDPVSWIRPGMTVEEVDATLGQRGSPIPFRTGVWPKGADCYQWDMGDRVVFVPFFISSATDQPPKLLAVGEAHAHTVPVADRLRALLGW